MRQSSIDRIDFYQSSWYEKLLTTKRILDSKQFLHSSLLYLKYATITARLYNDTREQNCVEANEKGTVIYPGVSVLGREYDVQWILNKLVLEWISHISNSLDCLMQYVSAALNLEIEVESVSKNTVYDRIEGKYSSNCPILSTLNRVWTDTIISHIHSAYNMSKHILDLFGPSNLTDVLLDGRRDIKVPSFVYRGKKYDDIYASSFMSYYDTTIADLYVDVLDAVYDYVFIMSPVPNRFHIGRLNIDGQYIGDSSANDDITLFYEMDQTTKLAKRLWIENPPFNYSNASSIIEIMPLHRTAVGQQLSFISSIECYENGKRIGVLRQRKSKLRTSTLGYHKYIFSP